MKVRDPHLEVFCHYFLNILYGDLSFLKDQQIAQGFPSKPGVDIAPGKVSTGDNPVQRTLEFLREHCEPGRLPLCGSSIHHDRRFLRRYMPELNEFFHYRNVDVSSIKEVVRRWHPRSPRFRKNSGHRALDDVRGSIQELAHYREHDFGSGR